MWTPAGPRAASRLWRYRRVRPGVRDVLDQQYLAPGYGRPEVARDLHDPRGDRGVPVAPHAQEVAGQVAGDRPHEVGHEDEGAPQHAHHGQRSGRQPGVDFRPQLGHAPGNGGRRRSTPRFHPHTVPDSWFSPQPELRWNWRSTALSLRYHGGQRMDRVRRKASEPRSPALALVAVALAACAGKNKNDVRGRPPAPPVEHIEMDPIKITGGSGPGRRSPRDLRRHRAVRAGRGGPFGEAL